MHKDIKMQNMFVVNAEDLESAELAVGDFGAAQWGEETVREYHGLPQMIILGAGLPQVPTT